MASNLTLTPEEIAEQRCQNRMVGYYKTGHHSGTTSRFAKRCGRKAGPTGYCWQHQRQRDEGESRRLAFLQHIEREGE